MTVSIPFQFEPIKTGRTFTHLKIKPFYIPKNRDPNLEQKELSQQTSIRWDIDKETVLYLKEVFSFTDKGLKNNRETIKMATEREEFRDWCQEVNAMVRKFKINNPAGFFISEIKKRIEGN
ncbi:MAG: hypothetical protein Q4G27_00445 [Flavobacteriaceae bacterium]|nr:hypothetical protein [Flavobacteriaceae bacterium]